MIGKSLRFLDELLYGLVRRMIVIMIYRSEGGEEENRFFDLYFSVEVFTDSDSIPDHYNAVKTYAVPAVDSHTRSYAGSCRASCAAVGFAYQIFWGQPAAVSVAPAFNEGEYEVAIEMYEELLGKGEANADVYYNLGNAYYRLDSMARAILSYERALLLQPGDEDARFNLQLARSKTIDKIAPEREMFFVTWYRSLVHLFTIDTWAYIAIISLAIAVLLLLVYFFSFSERLRRFTFITSVVLLGLFLLANLFAFQQKQSLTSHVAAIVLKDSLPVKNIPSDNGTDEFTIHAGTKVTITDDTMSDWKHILLPDGRDGWVQKESIEII